MASLKGILSTIKKNTLDRTDIDEKIGGFVSNAYNAVKNVVSPKLISPIPDSNWTPPTYTPTPAPRLQLPTPTLAPQAPAPTLNLTATPKTAPAQKLVARLDAIKTNKAVDAITGVARVGAKAVMKTASDVGNAANRFGKNIGNSFVSAYVDTPLLAREQAAQAEQDRLNMERMKQFKASGNQAGYDYLLERLRKSAGDTIIRDKAQAIIDDADVKQKETAADAITLGKTALTMASGGLNPAKGAGIVNTLNRSFGNPLPRIATNMGAGGALSYLFSKATGGEDPEADAARGASDAFGYTGITSLFTNPLIDKVANATGAKNVLLNQLLKRGVNAAGNVGEDELLAKLNRQEVTGKDRLLSAIIGAGMSTSANEGVSKTVKKKLKPAAEWSSKFFGNQYKKVARTYNKTIDSVRKPTVETKQPSMYLQTGMDGNKLVVGKGEYKTPEFHQGAKPEEVLQAMKEGRKSIWIEKQPQPDGSTIDVLTGSPKGEVKYELPPMDKNGLLQAKQEAAGLAAGLGVEQDENGNWKLKYDPARGLMVAGAMTGIKSEAGQKALQSIKLPEFPKVSDAWDSVMKEMDSPEVKESLTPEEAKQAFTGALRSKYISNIQEFIENKIGRRMTSQEVVPFADDVKELLKDGGTANVEKVIGSDNYLSQRFNYNKRSLSTLLKGQTPEDVAARLKGKDLSQPLDSEKPFVKRDPQLEDYAKNYDANGNPLNGKPVKSRRLDEILKPKPQAEVPKVEEIKVQPPQEAPKVETPKTETKFKVERTQVESLREAGYKKIDDIYSKSGMTDEAVREALKTGTGTDNAQLGRLRESFKKMAEMAGVDEKILKEQYFPDIHKGQKLTINSTYGGSLASTLFDFTKKNTQAIPDEMLVKDRQAVKQYFDWALSRKYGDVLEADQIMKTNNIPEEKADEVLDLVRQNKKDIEETVKPHLESTSWGDTLDYIAKNQTSNDQLSLITGQKVERPLIQQRAKSSAKIAFDSVLRMFRSEDNILRRYTNDDIYNAFKELRDREVFGTKRKDALQNFIDTASKYDYEDKQVQNIINQLIDTELKKGQHENTIAQQALSAATQTFSRANIGGNIKTVVTQPFEVYRIASEYGAKSLRDSVADATKRGAELDQLYGLKNEWQNTMQLKFKETDPKGFKKLLDGMDKVLYSGIEKTESWKNRVFVSAAEKVGKEKGLTGDALKTFVRDEIFRIAHNANEYNVPVLMKNKPLANALLQYSQFAWKNVTLKVDALEDKQYKKFAKLLAADIAAIGSIAAITGISLDSFKDYLGNTVIPTSFGPLISYPAQLYTDYQSYKSDKEKMGEENTQGLASRWGKTTLRNLVPAGGQISKTVNVIDILNKGYKESKNGNIIYATGERNPIRTGQALVFGESALPEKQEANKVFAAGENPVLSRVESKVLKDLPKGERKAYYDQESSLNRLINKQKSAEAQANGKPLSSIFGAKEAKASDYSGMTTEQKSFQRRVIKQKLDTGVMPNDSELKFYYFSEVDSMPTDTESNKYKKDIATYKAVDSIYSNENLDQAAKDRLIKLSGLSKDDVTYYNEAKDDATVKALRQEEALSTMSKQDWLNSLASGRRLVGNKQIVDNSTLDQLYERGVLSDSERDYLKAIKFDPATDKFYMDRDYKGGGETRAQKEKRIKDVFGAQEDILKSRKNLREDLSKPSKSGSSNTVKNFITKGGNTTQKAQSKQLSSVFGNFRKKTVTRTSQSNGKMRSSKYKFK